LYNKIINILKTLIKVTKGIFKQFYNNNFIMQPIIEMITKALNTVGVKVDASLLEGLNFQDLLGKIGDPKSFQNEITSQLMSKIGINSDMASKVGGMMDVSKLGDLAGMAGNLGQMGNMGDMGKMATGAVAAAGAGGLFGGLGDMVSNIFGHHEKVQEVAQETQEVSQEVQSTVVESTDNMGDMMEEGAQEVLPEISEEVVTEPMQEIATESVENMETGEIQENLDSVEVPTEEETGEEVA
jgi:hypothetical protein